MKLALIGDPVEHSRSPRLHQAFLQEAGIDGTYVAISVPRGNAVTIVRRMRLDGYTGCNVTYPLKEEVLRGCDILDEEAQRVQAVNTIFFGRSILGTTTDGIGARVALEALIDEPVSLKRIGVLGSGATARAILSQLHETDAYSYVWARNADRTAELCSRFEAEPWPPENPPEIIVSTLPPEARLPADILEQLACADLVMDVNYGPRATLGRILGREVVTGEAMLQAQARASFDFWLAHVDNVVE